MRQATPWVPVAEHLPQGRRYRAEVKNRKGETATAFCTDTGQWVDSTGKEVRGVTHWRKSTWVPV